MDEIEIEERVEFLKDSFIDGDLTEDELELFLEAALYGESPFFYDWFETKLETNEARHKRYANNQIYVYRGVEYELDGKQVVEIEDSEDVDRTISVTGSMPDDEHIEVVENEDEVSDEVKEKQEELRESILGSTKTR